MWLSPPIEKIFSKKSQAPSPPHYRVLDPPLLVFIHRFNVSTGCPKTLVQGWEQGVQGPIQIQKKVNFMKKKVNFWGKSKKGD